MKYKICNAIINLDFDKEMMINVKKIIYFIIFVIIILSIFSGIYLNYKMQYNSAKKENMDYEYYYEKEILGTELATIINKAIDNNEKNEVQKDENELYMQNNENSINIEIYITDNETTYKMEKIYNNQINRFVENYGNIKFKCTKIEYHNTTKKVSDLFFEQITE